MTLASLLAGRARPPLAGRVLGELVRALHKEAPALERFSQDAARAQGRIVGVDWSDARSGATAFIRRYGWTFPNVRDGKGVVGNDYDLTDLPTTFVLDSGGHIRRTLRGPQTEASLRQALRAAEAA